jgi:hypothetical protein
MGTPPEKPAIRTDIARKVRKIEPLLPRNIIEAKLVSLRAAFNLPPPMLVELVYTSAMPSKDRRSFDQAQVWRITFLGISLYLFVNHIRMVKVFDHAFTGFFIQAMTYGMCEYC